MAKNKIELNYFELLGAVYDIFEVDMRVDSDVKRIRSYSSHRKYYRGFIDERLFASFIGYIDYKDNDLCIKENRELFNSLISLLHLVFINLQKYQDAKVIKGKDLNLVKIISCLLFFISILFNFKNKKRKTLSPFRAFIHVVFKSRDAKYDPYSSARNELRSIVLGMLNLESKSKVELSIIETINKISFRDKRYPSKRQLHFLIKELSHELDEYGLDEVDKSSSLEDLTVIANSYSLLLNLIDKIERVGYRGEDLIDEVIFYASSYKDNVDKYIEFFNKNEGLDFPVFEKKDGLIRELVYLHYILLKDSENFDLYKYEPFELYEIDSEGQAIKDLYAIDNQESPMEISKLIEKIESIDLDCRGQNYLLSSLKLMMKGNRSEAFCFIKKANSIKNVKLNIISKLISVFYIGLKLSESYKMAPSEFNSQILNIQSKTIPSYIDLDITGFLKSEEPIEKIEEFIEKVEEIIEKNEESIRKTKESISYDNFERNIGFFKAISKYNNAVSISAIGCQFMVNPLSKINETLEFLFEGISSDSEVNIEVIEKIKTNKVKVNDIKVSQSNIGLHNVIPDILFQIYGLNNKYGFEMNRAIFLFKKKSEKIRNDIIYNIEKN